MALTDTFIRQVKHTGKLSGDKHTDGSGMYLLVKASGKYWRMDYTHTDKRNTLALGVYPAISLAKARQRREEARALLADGIDPNTAKREGKRAKAAAAANTFKAVAEAWMKATEANRAISTQEKVRAWFNNDVFPAIGKMPITEVGPRDVLAVVRKMENRGIRDSSKRVGQLCGQVFRYAVAEGSAERDVTTDLRGAYKQSEKRHYAAITDPKNLGELLRSIYVYDGYAYTQAALKLSPMLFLRPGELRTGEWAEIDFEAKEWRIPGRKMKMGQDHIVPLSRQAIDILKCLHNITGHGKYIFPSLRTGSRPMSDNTVNAALRGMGYSKDIHTAHGFRATARTIMDEVLGERVDLIEHQLAHAVRDANGRAYNRTAHLPARKEMMQRWSDYLDKLRISVNVTNFKTA